MNLVNYDWCGIVLNLSFPSEEKTSLKVIEKSYISLLDELNIARRIQNAE